MENISINGVDYITTEAHFAVRNSLQEQCDLLSTINDQEVAKLDRQKDATREAIIGVMREEADNTMTNEDATELCNKILTACNLSTIETLNRKYKVTVSYEGNELVTFSDVIAESEEAACTKVEDEMYYDETHEVRVQFEFEGNSREGEISFSIDSNEFEFDAEEQE